MPYKHRETGEYYDISRYSNFHGKVSQSFRPWNKNLENIDLLMNTIKDTLYPDNEILDLFIPYEKSSLLSLLE